MHKSFIHFKFIFLVVFVLQLISCRKAKLKQDSEFPDLPAYSEQGLNVGGVFINDQTWLTVKTKLLSRARPLNVFSYPNGDSLVLTINGDFKDTALQNRFINTLFIVIKDVKIKTSDDLLQLGSKTFTLDGVTNYCGFSSSFGFDKFGQGSGKIAFGKIARRNNASSGDGSANNPYRYTYILPAKFEMNVVASGNFSLRQGRFDMSVLEETDQFWILE